MCKNSTAQVLFLWQDDSVNRILKDMSNMNTIACFGDSLTEGKPGVSYIEYLTQHQGFNYGVGGESTQALLARLQTQTFKEAPRAVLFIGTNDLYLPYLKEQSEAWNFVVDRVKQRGSVPAKDVEHFSQLYEACIVFLMKKYDRLILINIPCIGEDTSSSLNMGVQAYNQHIMRLAQQYNLNLIDVFDQHQKSIEQASSYLSPHPAWMMVDQVITKSRIGRHLLSKKRHLSVSIDGIHLNDAAAKQLAQLIEKVL